MELNFVHPNYYNVNVYMDLQVGGRYKQMFVKRTFLIVEWKAVGAYQ